MRKSIAVIALVCICAIATLCIAGCGSPQPSSKSSSESLVVTSEPKTSSSSSSSSKAIDTKPVYMLAIGNDSRYNTPEDEDKKIKETDPSFSDTIMLMRLDPGKNNIAILSVPRDTATEIEGQPFKINDVHYAGGPKALCEYVGDMFGVQIPYYYDLKFVDFAALVDKLGGVTLNVPTSLTGGDVLTDTDITVPAGQNTLNGNEALMVVRQRKVYGETGEAIRQMLSREVVANTIQSYASKPASEAAGAASILQQFGETNMTNEELTAYIAAFMNNSGEVAFNLGTAPYMGGIDSTGAWRVPSDPALNEQLRAAMESGAPLSDLVPNPSV